MPRLIGLLAQLDRLKPHRLRLALLLHAVPFLGLSHPDAPLGPAHLGPGLLLEANAGAPGERVAHVIVAPAVVAARFLRPLAALALQLVPVGNRLRRPQRQLVGLPLRLRGLVGQPVGAALLGLRLLRFRG